MAMHDAAARLRDEGPRFEKEFISGFNKHPIGNLHTFAGFNDVRSLEERFLSAEEQAKYQAGVGHLPQAGR